VQQKQWHIYTRAPRIHTHTHTHTQVALSLYRSFYNRENYQCVNISALRFCFYVEKWTRRRTLQTPHEKSKKYKHPRRDATFNNSFNVNQRIRSSRKLDLLSCIPLNSEKIECSKIVAEKAVQKTRTDIVNQHVFKFCGFHDILSSALNRFLCWYSQVKLRKSCRYNNYSQLLK
jgi:hypothetical protein